MLGPLAPPPKPHVNLSPPTRPEIKESSQHSLRDEDVLAHNLLGLNQGEFS